ncbi:MAG: hypothetical protein IIA11_02650 [Proteobacteria bacterium]|nr:hypothetical protein [Pseudomonadota bacterium]
MPSLTLELNPEGKTHRRIVDGVRDRVQFSKNSFQKRHDRWRKDEEAIMAYLPEREADKDRRLVREAGKPQYTTIVVPYSYGVLMASHTYWTTVFMSRTPVLQYTGRHGETQQQIQAVEALIDYQMNVGQMLVPLYIWLLDVGKYSVGIIGTYWEEEESVVSSIEEVEVLLMGVIKTGRMKKQKITRKVRGYVGNKLYNVRPFDFFPDPRVPVHRFQEGEFCAVYNELGWNEILRRGEQGFYTNLDKLRQSPAGEAGVRDEGSSQLELPVDTDQGFLSSGPHMRKTKDVVKFFECTIELIPRNWGLGQGALSEKWVFTVTSDWKLCIGAQPLGALHNKFSFHVIEFEPEGYALVNRSLPEVLKPIQDTMDWLVNAHFYNVRKALNNQWVVDPSRVMMGDVLDPLPGGVIRLAPEAYGTDPKDPITQLAVVDVTANHLRDMDFMNMVGQRASGVSDSILGVLQQGGRKTATEVRTSSSFGINRLKTQSEYYSAMGWAPMSQMLLQNSQQYYDMEQKFRIVGDLARDAGEAFITITPDSIQGFYDFVPVDGTLPIDRFAQANLWRELLANVRQMPEIATKYDMGRIFEWVAQLAGLKNISQFRIEVQPDDVAAAAAQAGNLIPLNGGGGSPGAERDLSRVPAPQVSGNVGPTG